MKEYKLLAPAQLGSIALKNRIAMAPMTRSRALGNLPNDLMSTYYEQRAGAGLIVTEGTSPSPNGLGYARIPGIYCAEQVLGWKKTTNAVHKKDGKIILQLMHTGRISHPLNMPAGSRVLAPSAIKAAGQMYTDAKAMQDFPIPLEMTQEDIIQTKSEYVTAAKNAIEAGFDGVELHAANGYLLEQFLSPVSNIRNDAYGGSIDNCCRFLLEVATSVSAEIGAERTGIRLSPYGVFNDMPHYPEILETYTYLSEQLGTIGLAYIHLLDHSASGAPAVPLEIKKLIRKNFKNSLILCGGYDKEKAEADIQSGLTNLVAFGKPFINNPDLAERFKKNWPLSKNLQMALFYTADAKGYTDYPNYSAVEVNSTK